MGRSPKPQTPAPPRPPTAPRKPPEGAPTEEDRSQYLAELHADIEAARVGSAFTAVGALQKLVAQVEGHTAQKKVTLRPDTGDTLMDALIRARSLADAAFLAGSFGAARSLERDLLEIQEKIEQRERDRESEKLHARTEIESLTTLAEQLAGLPDDLMVLFIEELRLNSEVLARVCRGN